MGRQSLPIPYHRVSIGKGSLRYPPSADVDDGLYPSTFHVRPALHLLYLLPWTAHRAADAAYAAVAFVVQAAVWHLAYLIQELPHIARSPMDDGRYQQTLLAADAADGSFACGVGDVHALWRSASIGLFQPFFAILLKAFQRAAEFIAAYLHLVALRSAGALLMAYAYQRYLACACVLLIFVAAPAHPLGG